MLTLTLVLHGMKVWLLRYSFPTGEALSSTSPNQPVHLTPKAGAFFAFAILEQNFAFAKLSLAFGAGDSHVICEERNMHS